MMSDLMYSKNCFVSLSQTFFMSESSGTASVLRIEGSYDNHSEHVIRDTVVSAGDGISYALLIRHCPAASLVGVILISTRVGISVDVSHALSIDWAVVDAEHGINFMSCPKRLDIANYDGSSVSVLYAYQGNPCSSASECACTSMSETSTTLHTTVDEWHYRGEKLASVTSIYDGFTHFRPIIGDCPRLSVKTMHGARHRAGFTHLNNAPVVLKISTKDREKVFLSNINTLANFALIRASLFHPHIPKCYGACKSGNTLGYFIEKREGIHLPSLSSKELKQLGKHQKLRIAIQIADALYYIHRLSPFDALTHGDMHSILLHKPHNIVIDTKTAEASLIDLDNPVENILKNKNRNQYSQRKEVSTFGRFIDYLFNNGVSRSEGMLRSSTWTLVKKCVDVKAYPDFDIENALALLKAS